MSKPVVFVIGASGYIGAATVQALAAQYADKLDIRAGVRNPDGDKASKLKVPGVTVVKAEMGSSDLVDTLKGVDALYIVPPGVEAREPLVKGTAESAKAAGVKFILVISLPSPESTPEHPINVIEDTITAVGIPHCFVSLPFFYENYFSFMDTIKGQSTINNCVDPEQYFSVVAACDAGRACAAILSDHSKHVGKTYQVNSGKHTYSEIAAVFSDVLGRKVSYVRMSYDVTRTAMEGMGAPKFQIDAMLKYSHLIDNGVLGQIHVVGAYNDLTGEEPTDLETWLTPIADQFK